MNIHIFGHSICCRSDKDFPTFTDILVDKYNIKPHQLHIALCGSEERILYNLKKVKEDINLAIIFHGNPNLMFVPTLERDIMPFSFSEEFFNEKKTLSYFKNIAEDKSKLEIENISSIEFKQAYKAFIKFFYTRDLNSNRHNGALIQIDQYLKYKNIPAIHCVLDQTIPNWFNFTSGIVDTELTKIQKNTSQYYCNKSFSSNKINQEGNKIIADALCWYIERLAPRVGFEPT